MHKRPTLPLVDPATGLRRSAIRYPNGQPPAATGCRWCGVAPGRHGLDGWARSVGWHRWTHPTSAQISARVDAQAAAVRATARELSNA
jgi:hypothetical protein